MNDGWIDASTFPVGFTYFNAPWAVQLKINDEIDELIENALMSESENSEREERVAGFYQSYLSRDTINARGVEPIRDDLNEILSLDSHVDVARFMGDVRAASIFNLLVQPPEDMEGGYVLSVAQYRTTGLGLPSQEHYFSDKGDYPGQRESYLKYIASLFTKAGIENPTERAEQVLELETKYAALMWDLAQLRDAGSNFNKISFTELEAKAPGFPWRAFFEARGLNALQYVNVGVGAITESAAMFPTIPVEYWKSYFLYHWVDSHAQLLPDEFGDAEFSFYDETLRGVEERDSLPQRALRFVERYIGDDIGRLYADAQLKEETIGKIATMTEYIREVFRRKVKETEWMDEKTRLEALAKIETILIEIGTPQIGPDWSSLTVNANDPVANRKQALEQRWKYSHGRIGQPISRFGDWNMYPHRVGMGYHQQYNKIFISAGFLQPPFFDPLADLAVNYGGVGLIIGHEFGHALDDQGSRFDSQGRLREWWTAETRRLYEEKTQSLINQFSGFEAVKGVYLNSNQMIGEIVGDLTGTSVAYQAYLMHDDATTRTVDTLMDGFTGQQRYFLSAAQQNRSIITSQSLRNQALNAGHPPGRYRVNGIVRNLNSWYNAFEVMPTDSLFLVPDERVTLWGKDDNHVGRMK